MSSRSLNPWPVAGRDDPRDGPSTNNPDFAERLARDKAAAESARPPVLPATPPPAPRPVPVQPSGPPDMTGVVLFVEPVEGDGYRTGKYGVRVEAHEHTHPFGDAEKAARDALQTFEQWHRYTAWRSIEAAVEEFWATGPGRRFLDVKEKAAAARAERDRVDQELSAKSDEWNASLTAGDDALTARIEDELADLRKAEERERYRAGGFDRAVAEVEAATTEALARTIAEARRVVLDAARPRHEEARAAFAAAVREAFLPWLAAWSEFNGAETAGTGAGLLYSRRDHWEKLHKLR